MRPILARQFHTHSISTILALFSLFFSGPSLAQPCGSSPTPQSIFQTAHVFVAGVVVHDKKGKSVGGLSAADFVVLADGKPQRIVYFHNLGTAESTCTGIVIDRSGSRQRVFHNAEFVPIENFVASNVGSNHGAFFVVFGRPFAIGGYSTSPAELGRELQYVESVGPYGGTALNDAIELAAREIANAQGYRILLIVGEGDDNHSRSTPEEAIDSVLNARAAVYFIRFWPYWKLPWREPQVFDFTRTLTAETGGEVFPVHNEDDFDKAFTAFKEDLASMYLVGFSPGQLRNKREFHKLKISPKRKGLRVIAPSRFYWPK